MLGDVSRLRALINYGSALIIYGSALIIYGSALIICAYVIWTTWSRRCEWVMCFHLVDVLIERVMQLDDALREARDGREHRKILWERSAPRQMTAT